MQNFGLAALLWLLAGLAALVAGFLSHPRQILFLVAAVLFFAVSAMMLWRARMDRRSM